MVTHVLQSDFYYKNVITPGCIVHSRTGGQVHTMTAISGSNVSTFWTPHVVKTWLIFRMLPLTINTSIRDRGWEWWITIANYDCILGHIQRRKLTMCNEELMIRSQICLRLHSYKGFPMIRWGYPLFWRGTQAPSSRVTHPFHSSLLRVAHALYWTGTDTKASDNVKVSLSNSTLTDQCSSAARKEMDGKVFT